jgi:hypothetical protein
MFSYTYSVFTGAVKFDNGGFHQITLGINLFCKPQINTTVIVQQLIKNFMSRFIRDYFFTVMLIKSVNGISP